jgi:ABC-type dipeptide/oligopeptide/nickel transport system ATPase subunit
MLWAISGGAGFLGLHLARRLLAEGHAVRTLDTAPLDAAARRSSPKRSATRSPAAGSTSSCSRPRRTSSCRCRSQAASGTRPSSRDLLKKVGLSDRRTHRPSELSGGQQQRVALPRALVTKPTVVLADEPTGNLDSKTGGEILELLHDAVDSYGQTLVMVTHEARAAAIANRIVFLADGLIVRDLGQAGDAEIIETIHEMTVS